MQYFLIKHSDSDIHICATAQDMLPPTFKAKSIEISEEKYNELNLELAKNFDTALSSQGRQSKYIYLDENNEPQLRDEYTKWDSATKQWIPDDELLAQVKKAQFINKARQALAGTVEYDYPSYRSRLTAEQKQANDQYRAKLYDIIEGEVEDNELPINPNDNLKK